MAPKAKKKEQGSSKKVDQKKKQKAVEDLTFGLKNKHKSKKVQQHVESVTRSVMHSGDRKQRQAEEQRKKQKAALKEAKKAQKDEQDALFGDALMNIKKKTTTNKKEGMNQAKGRDAGDEDAKKGTSRAMKMMFQMDAQEMEEKLKEDPNYVPTLEDSIEAERQKKVAELKKSGKGTPINPETFAVWQEKKRKERELKAKKLVEAEMRKKKGGKGLAVLSGRDLFQFKKELFNDDKLKDDGDNNLGSVDETKEEVAVADVAAKAESDLFLDGDDDDLDDIEDD